MSEISKVEGLALGVGDPSVMTRKELIEFFEIVYPIESKFDFKGTLKQLKAQAEEYLLTSLNADAIKRNALAMSKSKSDIEPKYIEFLINTQKEYQKENQKIQETLKHFEDLLPSDILTKTEDEMLKKKLKSNKQSFLQLGLGLASAATITAVGLAGLAFKNKTKKTDIKENEPQQVESEQQPEQQVEVESEDLP